MLKQYKLRFYNFRLVIFLLAISVIGIILVGSARDDLRSKQMIGVIMGLIFMVILSLIDYSWISNFQWIMYEDSWASFAASFGEEYADRVMAVMPMWSIILVIAGIFIFAILGGLLGKALLKKHFAKAGIV